MQLKKLTLMAWKYVAVLDLYKNNGIKVCIVTQKYQCVSSGVCGQVVLNPKCTQTLAK